MGRAQSEINHGQKLVSGPAPEVVWGWGTEAGKCRALRRSKLIIARAGLKPGMRVLEIGCGTGNFTELFAVTGASIVAVDISPDLLAIARKKTFPAGNVTFMEKRFEECEVAGPFDAVVGSSVLHHLVIGESLRKIFDLLVPGGAMCFAEPNMMNPQIMLQKNIPALKKMMGDSPDETAFIRWGLARQLKNCGFTDVGIEPFDWLHPATPRAMIGMVGKMGALVERTPLIREFAGSLCIFARRPE